jgi:photosystem II stability/assembly factor-like uncharacterized protein
MTRRKNSPEAEVSKLTLSTSNRRHAMKLFTHALFFFLMVTQICFAQWYQQNSGTTQNLNALTFTDSDNGFAVGDSGTIMHTTDAGVSWVSQTSGTTLNLNDIFFIDAITSCIVGGGGIILRTTNGGITWVQQTSGTTNDLCGVSFIDANNGWIVGIPWSTIQVNILRTTNGGTTWTQQTSGTDYPLNDVCFIDINTGIAVGGNWGMTQTDGLILRTYNGGNTWTEQPTGTHTNLLEVVFVGANVWIAVGDESNWPGYDGHNILRTNDGGITWTPVLVINDWTFFNSVTFANENYGWAVGGHYPDGTGKIFFTDDGGLNWSEQISDITNFLNGVFFSDVLTGWAVGGNGTILHTINGGVPVELTSFTATLNGKEVILNWSTATELNNQLFEVQRSFEGGDFASVGFVNGKGTTTEPQKYTYSDKVAVNGKYSYRLKQIDYLGSYEYSGVVEVDFRSFNSYLLEQNYPNPFNPTTTIGFGIQNKSNVKITILNAIGEEVAVLLNEEREAGFYQVEFNASSLPSGVYFYQLRAGDFISTKKMMLLK